MHPKAEEVGSVPGHGGEYGARTQDLVHIQIDGLSSLQCVQLVEVGGIRRGGVECGVYNTAQDYQRQHNVVPLEKQNGEKDRQIKWLVIILRNVFELK